MTMPKLPVPLLLISASLTSSLPDAVASSSPALSITVPVVRISVPAVALMMPAASLSRSRLLILPVPRMVLLRLSSSLLPS